MSLRTGRNTSDNGVVVVGRRPGRRLPDLGICHGGTVQINRTIIARAILTLGAAGSIMAGTVAPIWASQASSVTAVTAASSTPNMYYNG